MPKGDRPAMVSDSMRAAAAMAANTEGAPRRESMRINLRGGFDGRMFLEAFYYIYKAPAEM
jgi:hypothetical protein